MMLSISIILMCLSNLFMSINISKLEKRVLRLEEYCLGKVISENEVDD